MKNKKKLIIIGIIIILIIIIIKIVINQSYAENMLKRLVVIEGDGLYKDSLVEERYIYKGSKPNNYLKLGKDLYRIISLEADGTIKVVKDKYVSIASEYDKENYRTSQYCKEEDAKYGCKVWGNKDNMYKNDKQVSKMVKIVNENKTYKLPNKNSSLNDLLNDSLYYDTLNKKVKNKIVKSYFGNGPIQVDNKNLKKSQKEEQTYKWYGNIGLISVIDYVKASNNSVCDSIYAYYKNEKCYKNSQKHNWLYKADELTISSLSSLDARAVIQIASEGNVSTIGASIESNVRPVFYLEKNIKLKGSGTKTEPYTIK